MLDRIPTSILLSTARLGLVSIALALVAGCASPRQYVYNCTPSAIVLDGVQVAAQAMEGRSTGPAGSTARFADGSLHAPLRVGSGQVDSFGRTNTWMSPANICRQFGSRVVVVDLR